MTTDRLMLVDTASLYFRAFYGLPDSLRAADGRPVNAVRGLLDFLARFIVEYRPNRLACCWDNDWRPQWRVDLLGSYKTHRVAASAPSGVIGAGGVGAESGLGEESPDGLTPQVPMIVEVLAALGLARVGRDGYEADDVIATLAERAASAQPSVPADIITGDRDLFQLVDDARGTRVLYVGRGVSRHERIDDAWVQAKYGISPRQYPDLAVLRGDPSDGIPGVKGVGEKTAASLLERFGALPEVLAAASRPGGGVSPAIVAKLHAAIDYLAVAPEVVAVVRDVDLGDPDLTLPSAPADEARFAALAEELNLGGSADRIRAALAG